MDLKKRTEAEKDLYFTAKILELEKKLEIATNIAKNLFVKAVDDGPKVEYGFALEMMTKWNQELKSENGKLKAQIEDMDSAIKHLQLQ